MTKLYECLVRHRIKHGEANTSRPIVYEPGDRGQFTLDQIEEMPHALEVLDEIEVPKKEGPVSMTEDEVMDLKVDGLRSKLREVGEPYKGMKEDLQQRLMLAMEEKGLIVDSPFGDEEEE